MARFMHAREIFRVTDVFLKMGTEWGPWVPQLVKQLPLAQVKISGSWEPASGSLLSREPASTSPSTCLSAYL